MKNQYLVKFFLVVLPFCFISFGCQIMAPKVGFVETAPAPKITSYTQNLRTLGLMTEIYDTGMMRIQSNPIGDETGASSSTGGEIPRDITEMTKSSLNTIGGNVLYIPYDPNFVQNQMVTGYSNFENKIIPDVVVSGGITEFDRGLETIGDSNDLGIDATWKGKPIGLEYGNQKKSGLARITLDFNLLNFQTLAGVPRMNTVNSMLVHKVLGENGFSVSLFGATFGSKGEVKKVQGRHDAVRLLVELSMIQIVGKYAGIPYWRLLDGDVLPDEDVLSMVKKFYYNITVKQRLDNIQEWVYIHGYNINLTGILDEQTHNYLKKIDKGHDVTSSVIPLTTFENLYINLPVTEEALARKNRIVRLRELAAKRKTEATDRMELVLTPNKASYSMGDEFVLSVMINKDSFLRCYYQDGDNTVAQIYPNPFQTEMIIKSRTEVLVPSAQVAAKNFTLKFFKADVTEIIMCIASRAEFPAILGSALFGPGLEPIAMKNVEAIQTVFESNMSENEYVISNLELKVH